MPVLSILPCIVCGAGKELLADRYLVSRVYKFLLANGTWCRFLKDSYEHHFHIHHTCYNI